MNTIPQIADMLRHHLNTDNNAMSPIVDHILPELGFDCRNVREMEEAATSADLLVSLADDLETLRRKLKRDIQHVSNCLMATHRRWCDIDGTEDETGDLEDRIEEVDDLLEHADELGTIAARIQ